MPLHRPPGHAQIDFGEAVVELRGRREKVAFFCLILPHSDVWFVKAYPRETTQASHPVHESIEARDEKRLLRLQDRLARVNLPIVDELGYVPLSQTGSELLFDVFSRRYENGATIVTSKLPFQEWTTVFASGRLTGALLDRIAHHVHILELNAERSGSGRAGRGSNARPNNTACPRGPTGPTHARAAVDSKKITDI